MLCKIANCGLCSLTPCYSKSSPGKKISCAYELCLGRLCRDTDRLILVAELTLHFARLSIMIEVPNMWWNPL